MEKMVYDRFKKDPFTMKKQWAIIAGLIFLKFRV